MSEAAQPVIGIPTRSFALPNRRIPLSGVFSNYVECLQASGCEAILLPPGSIQSLGRLDALLFIGGEDLSVEKAWWSSGGPTPPTDPERDLAEALLVERAWSLRLPVLGICRGAQLVNCVRGGTIGTFDAVGIARHSSQSLADSSTHHVRVEQDTRIASVMFPKPRFEVVSRHSVQITGLGVGLRASAWAEDGSIEAIEAIDWPFLGVQWHAEWSAKGVEPDLDLFRWLAGEAKLRMQS
jgi:putative glutamine amidotransferase